MVEKEASAMTSALLTATMKSLKVLQNMQKKQDDLLTVVSNVSEEQKTHLAILKEIRTKPEPEILADIKDIVTHMTASLDTIDLDGLLQDINKHTSDTVQGSEQTVLFNIKHAQKVVSDNITNAGNTVVEKVDQKTSQLSDTLSDMREDMDDTHKKELAELNEIKQSSNLEALRKLINGLQNQQKNMNKLADYIQVLSENVQNGRKDTVLLAQTIQESASRIKSMDFRMATLTGEESDDAKDLDQSLALLEDVSSNSHDDMDMPDLDTVNAANISEINALVNDLDVE